MSKRKFKRQNLKVEKDVKENLENVDVSGIEGAKSSVKKSDVFEENPKIFILNNLLMSVQFFENYERDIKILRENWFKEISLQGHRKKCFNADSLFRLVGTKVKFRPLHGINKNNETLLHPLRIFIIDDSLVAAYDPEVLRKIKRLKPCYQLIVRPCEDNKKDKSGYVSLVEFQITDKSVTSILRTKTSSNDSPASKRSLDTSSGNELLEKKVTFFQKKPAFDLSRNNRKLTKTEKIIGLQSKNLTSEKLERRSSLVHILATNESTIPHGGFYNYLQPVARLQPKSIHDFRMNNIFDTSQGIPRRCFQTVEVKKNVSNSRRNAVKRPEAEACFTTQTFLNSAAYKGYFCDELIENLTDLLGLDFNDVTEGLVCEENVIINQKGVENYIVPVVKIEDWNKHVEINNKPKNNKILHQMEWPTPQMKKIINILPCYAVPKGYSEGSEENLDYEKEWKLVFPKIEEFLLLHTMHAHIRCYFFVLAIYKTFIEMEVSSASFGPRHLIHLLLWMVQKDFLAWPEDRPGETLIKYLKILYKKLQNKSLCDFFITSRNLFADSLPKDLHKTQTIIKKILENPVPHILRAVRNLHMESNFYQIFDTLKLYEILTKTDTTNKPEKRNKTLRDQNKDQTRENEMKRVHSEDDEERQWKRKVIKQINLEKKTEEEERLRRLSIDSINVEGLPQMSYYDSRRYQQIVEIFLSHFLEMGMKSAEHKALDQALIYLYQIQKLTEYLTDEKTKKDELIKIKKETDELKNQCDKLKSKTQSVNLETQVELRKEINKSDKKDLIKYRDGSLVIEIVDKETKEVTPNDVYCKVMETKL